MSKTSKIKEAWWEQLQLAQSNEVGDGLSCKP
jgi:hypothetical protein